LTRSTSPASRKPPLMGETDPGSHLARRLGQSNERQKYILPK
jgi:hypothetical protein